ACCGALCPGSLARTSALVPGRHTRAETSAARHCVNVRTAFAMLVLESTRLASTEKLEHSLVERVQIRDVHELCGRGVAEPLPDALDKEGARVLGRALFASLLASPRADCDPLGPAHLGCRPP